MILGVVSLIALAVVAVVALKRPQLSATEQLAKAEQDKGSDRTNALVALGSLPDATDVQLARAGALLAEAKEWDAVLSLVDPWLLKNPKSLDARLLEAKAAVQTRKGKRAETAVHEAGALAPNDARPDAVMAELRELQADSGAALEAWSKAVGKAPGNAQYLSRQGYWLSQAGRLDDAEAALTRANKKHNDPATTAELGFVKYRKDQKEEAMKLLRSVVKEKPDLLEGHYYLATVLFQKNDLTAARAEYLAADALAGTDSRPLTALCEMEQMQKTSELPSVQKKIRERFPKEADALLSKCAAAAPP
jgi:Flp pilus assembly protein TadD